MERCLALRTIDFVLLVRTECMLCFCETPELTLFILRLVQVTPLMRSWTFTLSLFIIEAKVLTSMSVFLTLVIANNSGPKKVSRIFEIAEQIYFFFYNGLLSFHIQTLPFQVSQGLPLPHRTLTKKPTIAGLLRDRTLKAPSIYLDDFY